MKNIVILSVVLFLISCDSDKVKSKEDANNSTKLFLELWEIFDQNYAFFELRNVNWEEEKKIGLQKMSSVKNDSLLFREFCNVLKKFDDSHINLESDQLNLHCNSGKVPEFYKEFPTNESYTTFLEARDESLINLGIDNVFDSASQLFQFGISNNGEWGFFRIKRFYGESLLKIQEELNIIIEKLKDMKHLIIDTRVNPGGNDETALLCASYFFKQEVIAFIKSVRNGRSHNDFSRPDTTYLFPNKTVQFTDGQIYLLVNGASGSSADVFALVMSYLPRLTIVGTNTEGIFSNMYRDTLSNGWRLTLSNERYFSKDMVCFEKVGIPVDIYVENKKEDTNKGKDLLIERIKEEALKMSGVRDN